MTLNPQGLISEFASIAGLEGQKLIMLDVESGFSWRSLFTIDGSEQLMLLLVSARRLQGNLRLIKT